MATTSNVFASLFDQAMAGNIVWASHTLKLGLLTSSASPSLGTWVHWSDVTNETTGTGYSAGGVTVSTPTHVITAANSWGTAAATSTAYTAGQIVRPSSGNGFLYRCVTAGTSGGSAPSWPTTVGLDVTDGSAVWVNAGESITVYSTASASWSTATISAQYGVLYDANSGTASTEPLIALINFGTTISSTANTFTVPPDATLGWFSTTPA